MVITDASGDGFGHILLQRRESNVFEARAQATNIMTGEVTSDNYNRVISFITEISARR